MFDVARMFETEISFCDSFTNRIDTEYGKIYYNPLNPHSYDSNHAHIFKLTNDLQPTISDIKRFYQNYKLTPRIYPSFITGELEVLRPYLESAGFEITIYNEKTFFYPSEKPIRTDLDPRVKRITSISQDIVKLIHSENDGDWTKKVLENHIHDENFHLLGLYEEEKCMSMASVKIMDGYSRVDDVLTHKQYRGLHFGTKLIEQLIAYHDHISSNQLYLWATDQIAIKMYSNVGFKEVHTEMHHWTASAE